VLVETDFLLAIMNEKDRLHKIFIDIMEKERLMLSPFSLIELNMLYLCGKLVVKDYEKFQEDLNSFLDYYSIKIISDSPIYHSKAFNLRKKYNVSYFDSLHASVAIVKNVLLLSSDSAYSKIKELKVMHPKSWKQES